ncbi:MAG: 2-hydroxyacid dehydrogenase [Coriobacteriia bacterium]|nr:2-hydroxyacid dehydrogenase [Coriobacteriia bacterium]
MKHLVWLPAKTLEFLGDPPEGLEIAPIPDDIEHAERLGDVEFLVISSSLPSGNQPRGSRPKPAGPFEDLWDRMPSLRYVQTLSAGVDQIVGSIPPGVSLCSARGVHDGSVSEWVLTAILAGLKNIVPFRDNMREGRWEPMTLPGLSGANIVLLGYGDIGHAVERRLEPFGPGSICRIARRPKEGIHTADVLPEVLPRADVVVLLLPLTEETQGIVDSEFLAQMKPGALLVNAARGKLVDTTALLEALRAGHIRAVLDVVDPEPLPADHPLWQAPGLLITPHIAGLGAHFMQRAMVLIRDQLERLAHDEPLRNVVRDGY